MENSVKERLKKFLDESKLTGAEFCRTIGVSQGFISGMRESIQPDKLKSIAINYPSLDIGWLMTGLGNMRKTEVEKELPNTTGIVIDSEENYNLAKKQGIHLLPEVNFKFAAGQTQLINGNEDITRYWFLPDCRDCEGVAQVVGRSMSPTLPSGSWVALKRLPLPIDNPNTIPFGNIFGVVVEDKYTGEYHGHIKILRRYKDGDLSRKYWIAHSINEDEFDDFDIEISQVRSLWIVKQHIVSDIL